MVVEWLDANKLRAFDNRDALCLWLAVCAAGTPAYEMVNPPVTDPDPDPTEPEPEVKDGIVAESDSLYYYVDGVLTYAGLIQIDAITTMCVHPARLSMVAATGLPRPTACCLRRATPSTKPARSSFKSARPH